MVKVKDVKIKEVTGQYKDETCEICKISLNEISSWMIITTYCIGTGYHYYYPNAYTLICDKCYNRYVRPVESV